jgi:hypothetical protein
VEAAPASRAALVLAVSRFLSERQRFRERLFLTANLILVTFIFLLLFWVVVRLIFAWSVR